MVVETGDGKWANPIPVEFIKDTIELSQNLQKGQKVTIDARLNGREWQGKDGVTKWFTSISGYKIQSEDVHHHPLMTQIHHPSTHLMNIMMESKMMCLLNKSDRVKFLNFTLFIVTNEGYEI